MTCTDEDSAMAVDVVPGQAADAPPFEPIMQQTEARAAVLDEVVADKAFDSAAIRRRCAEKDQLAVIPNRKGRTDPWPEVPETYRERNRIERLFGKLKQYRRVATRYDKLKGTFLGFIWLALGLIKVRKRCKPTT